VLTRAALLLVALAAAGWLASAYPGARDEARADEIRPDASGRLAPAQIARAIELLEGARRARPDGAVVPRLAGMHLSAGRRERAAELVRPITESEPENVTAWTVLALAETDPFAARDAEARRRALAPPPRRVY
jgi:predicted Zn-dependent protease